MKDHRHHFLQSNEQRITAPGNEKCLEDDCNFTISEVGPLVKAYNKLHGVKPTQPEEDTF